MLPNEKELLILIEDELISIGHDCVRFEVEPDRWDLLARLQGSKAGESAAVICLNSHADTVPQSGESVPKARISNGKLYGLGSCDDKASIAAMISAIRSLADDPPPGIIDLLISVDEEGGGQGVDAAIKQGYRCDFAIVGEPSSLNVVYAHAGLLFIDVQICGVAAHGSVPWEGISAIERMMELEQALRAAISSFPEHPVIGPPSINMGIIRAGDVRNRVPDQCSASFDIRVVPPARSREVLDQIEYALHSFGEDCATWRIAKNRDPLVVPENSLLVETLVRVAGELTGGRSRTIAWRGWTEAESFRTGLGIDAAVFGPGDVRNAHTGNEFVEIEEVGLAARAYEAAVRMLCTGQLMRR